MVNDGQGGSNETWCDVATVWAYVEPTKSNERFFSQQIQYQRTHKVTIRHLDNVTTDMRFIYDNRTFQIKGIRRPDERKYFLIIDAEENRGT